MKNKLVIFAALVAYIVALNLGAEHSWWAALSFFISFIFASLHDEISGDENLKQLAILYTGLLIIGIFLVRERIRDDHEDSRFAEYLSVHQCQEKGMEITGYTEISHDRFTGSDGGDEIKEMIYFCRATGRLLSRSDFDGGSFGERPE